MGDNKYVLSYLPTFYDDLQGIVDYILQHFANVTAANRLIDDVEKAILRYLDMAETPEIYQSDRQRKYPYRRIYVRNFVIYYVVKGKQCPKVMEIRRIFFARSETGGKI